ncbi:TetR/AcrR family transcriptional regulator [Amycolatopsis sp. BJA-103]|uniref:TetR/AcrR family transcriptional regulator n=1 Tax=unclassified Amycolatopsis TaxID=2618356 RepID=UPI000C762E07|nr:TetR/AcrR family transcriptional regulator [Amycolatopsis sp. BJA-103]AUI57395.1 TetR family transcriptional regulator [Amycolatopsis sp. BJA-103]PNE14009.1 TetR family transcriptional regulator [Amycolatopsis sp. BJA-103]
MVKVPKQVDHTARRVEIAEALRRLTATRGLEGVSLRHVAAEAGISMGLVQHYFKTKDEMLLFAIERRSQMYEERLKARLDAGEVPSTPKAILRAIIAEILPLDERRRGDWLMGVAFFIRSISDPSFGVALTEGVPQLFELFAVLIRQGQDAGDVDKSSDAMHEATILWALADSQGTNIVMKHRTPDEAMSTVDYYLDRLFGSAPVA